MHRDLKATNIFVTEYNAVEIAKVLDFGVAKAWGEGQVGEGVDLSEVTRKGIAVGTPEYLAPEIIRGGPASPHSDQYALGIVLYAALTGGRRPFEAQRNGEFRDLHLLQAILKGDHPGPRSYHDEIPEALERVIERAMAHDPEQRYSSVHALGEALLEWASPRARMQWTAHFTSAPKPAAVQPSMAISPEEAAYVRKAAAEARPAPRGPRSPGRGRTRRSVRRLWSSSKTEHRWPLSRECPPFSWSARRRACPGSSSPGCSPLRWESGSWSS